MRETKSNDAIIIADEKGYKVLDDGSVVAVKVPVGKKVLYNRAIELTDGYMLVKENEILCVVTE